MHHVRTSPLLSGLVVVAFNVIQTILASKQNLDFHVIQLGGCKSQNGDFFEFNPLSL